MSDVILSAIIAAVLSFVLSIIRGWRENYKKRNIAQLDCVYTPIYREICFSPLENNQQELIKKLYSIVYENFKYVPEDLFELVKKIVKNSKKKDYILWNDHYWKSLIRMVEKQYYGLQKKVHFDKSLYDENYDKYIISNVLYFLVLVITIITIFIVFHNCFLILTTLRQLK